MAKPEKYLLGLQYFAEDDETPADPAIGKTPAAVSTNDVTASVITELTNQLKAVRAELDLLKPKASQADEYQTAYQSVVSELEKQKALQERSSKRVQLEQGLQEAMKEYNISEDVMDSIINSYKTEEELLELVAPNPKAALRAYHWAEIAPGITQTTKPLEVGSTGRGNTQQATGGFSAEEFLKRKKSNSTF